MLKVFQIFSSRFNKYGGIKRHCLDLSSLFKNDKEIFITLLPDETVGYLPFIRKAYFRNLYNVLKKQNCDVVHIHGFGEFSVIQAIVTAKFLKKTIVYSPHFHPIQYLQHPMLGRIFFHCLLRPVLPLASTIITITESDTIFFKKFHSNVVQIPHYFKGEIACENVSECKKKNMLLFVGRNEENKGIDHLYKLPAKYEVHCVTKGPLLRKDFIIHSDISDNELNMLYKEAALVVIPSRYEAFSYVALEAFAHGTPVVMSDRVQIADYLKDKCGYSIFKYSDYDSFLDAVEKTINTKVDIEAIMSVFTPSIIKNLYRDAYLQATKN